MNPVSKFAPLSFTSTCPAAPPDGIPTPAGPAGPSLNCDPSQTRQTSPAVFQ